MDQTFKDRIIEQIDRVLIEAPVRQLLVDLIDPAFPQRRPSAPGRFEEALRLALDAREKAQRIIEGLQL